MAWKDVNFCEFYVVTVPETYTAWSDITFPTNYKNITDLKVDRSIATETIKIRNTSGYDITLLGNRAGKLTFKVYDDGGALINLLRTANKAKATVLVKITDGPVAESGTNIFVSPMVIPNFSDDQAGSIVAHDVEMAVAYDSVLEPTDSTVA